MTNKLSLEMSVQDAVVALSEGNIGAVNVLVQIMKDGEKYDPYCDPFMVLCGFDNASFGETLYGPRIWMLYKDVCGQNLGKMLLVLRAHQLGYLSWSKLNEALPDFKVNLVQTVEAVS